MEKLLAGLKLDYWYKVLVLIGAIGGIGAAVFELKGIANTHAMLVCWGGFFIGMGEWINHPLQTRIAAPGVYGPTFAQITGHPRNPRPMGIVFDLAGLALFVPGVWKMATA